MRAQGWQLCFVPVGNHLCGGVDEHQGLGVDGNQGVGVNGNQLDVGMGKEHLDVDVDVAEGRHVDVDED